MATHFSRFMELPPELRNMVWQHSMIPGPGVQFMKPNNGYNGTLLGPVGEVGPGVADISSLSAACEHARLSMVSTEAKEAVEQMIRNHEMTRIIMNPPLMAAPLHPASRHLLADTSEWPRIIMDKVNDISVFSSFRSDHFSDASFSGGIASMHPELKDSKIVGISMPRCNREADDTSCSDCGNNYADKPGMLRERVEFCGYCVAFWTADLQDVELVYLIVPGVRRAQAGDEVEVLRFGEESVISDAFDAMPEEPSQCMDLATTDLPALGTRPAMTIEATQTTEALGRDGPRCFNGCGITLFEVPSSEVPKMAHEVMEFMFDTTHETRCDFARDDGDYSPCPRNPSHCGGAIEFRFLSYQAS